MLNDEMANTGVEELLRLTSPVPNLARVELQVLIQEVLRRLPDYEVVPAEVVRYPGLNRGMSGLGARFTPGPREEAEQ